MDTIVRSKQVIYWTNVVIEKEEDIHINGTIINILLCADHQIYNGRQWKWPTYKYEQVTWDSYFHWRNKGLCFWGEYNRRVKIAESKETIREILNFNWLGCNMGSNTYVKLLHKVQNLCGTIWWTVLEGPWSTILKFCNVIEIPVVVMDLNAGLLILTKQIQRVETSEMPFWQRKRDTAWQKLKWKCNWRILYKTYITREQNITKRNGWNIWKRWEIESPPKKHRFQI